MRRPLDRNDKDWTAEEIALACATDIEARCGQMMRHACTLRHALERDPSLGVKLCEEIYDVSKALDPIHRKLNTL